MPAHVQSGPQRFWSALDAATRQQVMHWNPAPTQPLPLHYATWWCDEEPMGLLSPERGAWLAQQLSHCSQQARGWVWHVGRMTRAQRNAELQGVLEGARAQGLLTGWRNERFSFWHSHCNKPDPRTDALVDVERAGFRFLGMLSHAVHVNGYLPDGRMWLARRSPSKATDPGMLDNLSAGGLPAGESVLQCMRRELAEEAGLYSLLGATLQSAGHIRTSRLEPEGWHDEVLHVFNLTLAPSFVPRNGDGEVAEFMCLSASEVIQRAQAGELTADATQALLLGLGVTPTSD